MSAARLHEAVALVAPIEGVSMGTEVDRSTWAVQFAPSATDAQKLAAQAVLAAFDPAAPRAEDVEAERARRIETAFRFLGRSYQLDAASQSSISTAGLMALQAIVSGVAAGNLRWSDPGRDFEWIAAYNTRVPMDAPTCLAFAKAAAVWNSAHVQAARTLKDTQPIPADYADNRHWPS